MRIDVEVEMRRPRPVRGIRKSLRRAQRGRLPREVRGRLLHARYSLAGNWPDPDVPDDVVADRVRSMIGPLEKRLDVPHVNVSVCGRIVTLHGAVASREDADAIAAAAFEVPGVLGVESYLHIGLAPCETRPSTGRARHLVAEIERSLAAD